MTEENKTERSFEEKAEVVRALGEDLAKYREELNAKLERIMGERKPTEGQPDVVDITRAIRIADAAFEKTGGSSRHWVVECLLPALEDEGLAVVRVRPRP